MEAAPEKLAQARLHSLVLLPGGRNESRNGLCQGVTSAERNLKSIIEAGRVAHSRFEERSLAWHAKRLGKHRLACPQPAAIAAYRVDFAVMRHKTKGLGQSPAGLRVGRVALVKDGKGAVELRIGEIKIEGGQLLGRKQALVDDRTGRKRAEVNARIADLHFLAQAKQAQFQI